ncbi:nucleotidyltransferase substrate binding protein [Clostridium sp. MSJ-11]|uniref:Nucleotidyltransferase substrate binding protein n=1 Tax=Clostridium mobile TaxID=2841512 RepID=A0ABS6EKK2_9CLOT|nr:nucleotidyltransferase substrate binding protein [Clostridium mobile]MBU5485746.1 nucleotidyltransferase substrate binding protein [Clostridium mobile]
MNKNIYWQQRLSNYKKAIAQLTEFIEKDELDRFEIKGLIQCFEYTFELALETMKAYLEQEEFEVKSPRATMQNALKIGLIADEKIWIDALEKRNLIQNTYDVEVAKESEELIRKSYYPIIKELHSKLGECILKKDIEELGMPIISLQTDSFHIFANPVKMIDLDVSYVFEDENNKIIAFFLKKGISLEPCLKPASIDDCKRCYKVSTDSKGFINTYIYWR